MIILDDLKFSIKKKKKESKKLKNYEIKLREHQLKASDVKNGIRCWTNIISITFSTVMAACSWTEIVLEAS